MRRFLIVLSAAALVSTTALWPSDRSHRPDRAASSGGHPRLEAEIVGYFIQWGIYGRGFFVKDLIDNGSAEKLTVINYAFGNVAPNPAGDVVCQSGDTWADYGRPTEPRTASTASATLGRAARAATSGSSGSSRRMYPDLKVQTLARRLDVVEVLLGRAP